MPKTRYHKVGKWMKRLTAVLEILIFGEVWSQTNQQEVLLNEKMFNKTEKLFTIYRKDKYYFNKWIASKLTKRPMIHKNRQKLHKEKNKFMKKILNLTNKQRNERWKWEINWAWSTAQVVESFVQQGQGPGFSSQYHSPKKYKINTYQFG
jgi:hypothetical protein